MKRFQGRLGFLSGFLAPGRLFTVLCDLTLPEVYLPVEFHRVLGLRLCHGLPPHEDADQGPVLIERTAGIWKYKTSIESVEDPSNSEDFPSSEYSDAIDLCHSY